LLPEAEHRQCARHIYANFKKRFSGAHYEKLFWRASKASTEPLFNAAMKEIQLLSPAAHQHLMDRDPKTWSRAFFQVDGACDAVENGNSESFNATILEARRKPIITMFEEIRVYVMQRMYAMQVLSQNWSIHQVCPSIRDKLNNLKKLQRSVVKFIMNVLIAFKLGF